MVKLIETLRPSMAQARQKSFTVSCEAIRRFSLESRLLDLYVTDDECTTRGAIWRISNHFKKQCPTCRAAPLARGTPIDYELKTLVLTTDCGPIVANIPATNKLSLNYVKKSLGLHNVHLAAPSALPLPPGRICTITPPFSRLHTILCTSLFETDFLTTNDTTISAFFLFDPYVLTLLPNITILNISK